MKKIPLSQTGKNAGKYFALVDDEDYEELNKYKWQWSQGCALRGVYLGAYSKSLLMHREILKVSKEQLCDHIDGNRLNNQKYNLRIANKQENNFNRVLNRKNTSGFKGVYFYPKKLSNNYRAQIGINNKMVHIGCYSDIIEAAKAYNQKALELFGEFAKLNQLDGLQ